MPSQLKQNVAIASKLKDEGFGVTLYKNGHIEICGVEAFHALCTAIREQSKASLRDVPDGWQLVPIELTRPQAQEMIWAYEEAMGGARLPDGDSYDFIIVQKMHNAMLSAAPTRG